MFYIFRYKLLWLLLFILLRIGVFIGYTVTTLVVVLGFSVGIRAGTHSEFFFSCVILDPCCDIFIGVDECFPSFLWEQLCVLKG